MAWLNATPKPDPRTKRAKTDDQPPPVSRIERMRKDGTTAKLPPNPLPHIISRLVEIGLTEANGMGASPLSWREINEWQHATGVDLPAWEARLIRHLSVAYIAESRRAESENCPPPWRAEVTDREREAAQARLELVLG
jgi:hypothetical protein